MAYCEATDLLLGDLPTGAAVNPQRYVDDASDQIDQAIGHLYRTPVDLSSLSRPAALSLKRINIYLASGRILMQSDLGDNRLHALGKYYVDQALASLQQVESGQFPLDGAIPMVSEESFDTGPRAYNEDSDSLVKSFYQTVSSTWPVPQRHLYG